MSFWSPGRDTARLVMAMAVLSAATATEVWAQERGRLQVTVVDQTGGAIAQATVALARGSSVTLVPAQEGAPGIYAVANVRPQRYRLFVQAPLFAPVNSVVEIEAGRRTEATVTLTVLLTEELEVAGTLSVDRRDTLTALTLTGRDLALLPSNEIEMLYRLLELAGSRGRPGDVGIYVDGFRDFRRLPPKSAIELIQINAEPYSAEFSEPGTRRIEIITKPGSDRPFGEVKFDFNDETLNATEPFATDKPPLQRRNVSAFFMTPLVPQRWGLQAYAGRWETDENAVVNATVLDNRLEPQAFRETLAATNRINNLTINTGFALSQTMRLRGEYSLDETRARNQGLQGGFSLPEHGLSVNDTVRTGRLSLLSVIGANAVYELRAQFREQRAITQAKTEAMAIQVFDAFMAGGNQQSLFNQRASSSLQIETKLTKGLGSHTLKVGVQADGVRLAHVNQADFGGTYTFGADVERDATGAPILGPNGTEIAISPLENYRRTLSGLSGYGPSLFSIARGDPTSGLRQLEGSAYVQDDWLPSPAFTLSLGLRYEAQTHLYEWWNLSPRLGLAWSLGDRGGVVRAGTGLFHSRFDASLTMDTVRLDGRQQQRIVVERPSFFPLVPDPGFEAPPELQTIMVKAKAVDAPRQFISSVHYEKELTPLLLGSVGVTWEQGSHLSRLRDINTPAAPEGARPIPGIGQVLQFDATGRSDRRELQLGLRLSLNTGSRIFTNYTRASTKADGDPLVDRDRLSALPADSSNLAAEFGPTATDEWHRLFISGSLWLPKLWILAPSFTATSAHPFNITTGLDNNGDTHLTDRPAFADTDDADGIETRFGRFDYTPDPGDRIIPRNFGRGAPLYKFDLSLSKVFTIGDPLDPRRTLTISFNSENLLNTTRLRDFNGVLLSPVFGRANTAEPRRRVSMGLAFTF